MLIALSLFCLSFWVHILLQNHSTLFRFPLKYKREDLVKHTSLPSSLLLSLVCSFIAASLLSPRHPLLPHTSPTKPINLYPSSFPHSCFSSSLIYVTAISAPFCLHFPTSVFLLGLCTSHFSHGGLFTKWVLRSVFGGLVTDTRAPLPVQFAFF